MNFYYAYPRCEIYQISNKENKSKSSMSMLSRNALRASLLFYAVKASIKAIKKPLRLQKYNKNLIYANHLQKKLRSAWATPALRLFLTARVRLFPGGAARL